MPHTLEIIIKWLQVSVSKCNRQTPQTEIGFVSWSTRNLVSSDQTTCIIASRANFFITNLRERFDVLVLSVSDRKSVV